MVEDLGYREAPVTMVCDTGQIAQRLLANAVVLVRQMPPGFTADAFNILLMLYRAPDDASCMPLDEVRPPGLSHAVAERWITALASEGLLERTDRLVALSPAGHARVRRILTEMFEAQRSFG